jgi:hypothetical protein
MNLVNTAYTSDLEDAASMLRQYGDVCMLWKRGWTASFRWMPSRADHTESMKASQSRISNIFS